MNRPRTIAAVSLLSVSLLDYQVAVVQLFSLMQWYHYANMVISVALLGFGAAGTVLSLKKAALLHRITWLLPALMLGAGAAMLLALVVGNAVFARFDSYLLFVERRQWLALAIHYMLFFLPFFLGALALGIIFVAGIDAIGTYYFANMAGSGAGALLAAMAAYFITPPALPGFAALFSTAAGALLVMQKGRSIFRMLITVLLLLAAVSIAFPLRLHYSAYKSVSRTLTLPAAKIISEQASPHGYLQVLQADAMRYAPSLSLQFTGEVPVRKALFSNGDWFGPLGTGMLNDSVHLLDYTTMALPYVAAPRAKVLVLHAGTGFNIAHAFRNGAQSIDAVEPNNTVNHLLRGSLAADTDSLYYHPALTIHALQPRLFVAADKVQYDLIQLPATGAFGGAAGIFSMKEEFTLTTESIADMVRLLRPGGVICGTVWMDYPFRNPIRMAATMVAGAKAAGIPDPAAHMAAVRSWGMASFILKKEPLDAHELQSIRSFCDRMAFDPLLLTGITTDERMFYNALGDSTLFRFLDDLQTGREEMLRDYDFNVLPPTDDKPFFSQFLRLQRLSGLSAAYGAQSTPFIELGLMVTLINVLQLCIFAWLLIVLPLMKTGIHRRNRGWVLFYFGGLGLGYIMLEVTLIQQFILFTGNAVHASAMVLAVMLLASGGGSYVSEKFPARTKTILRLLLLVSLLIFSLSLFLPRALMITAWLPGWAKPGLLVLLVAIPAFPMGMAFPLGLRLLDKVSSEQLPWAWGVNGCMSVVGASLVPLVAVEAGFTVLLQLSALAYITCSAAMFSFQRKHQAG